MSKIFFGGVIGAVLCASLWLVLVLRQNEIVSRLPDTDNLADIPTDTSIEQPVLSQEYLSSVQEPSSVGSGQDWETKTFASMEQAVPFTAQAPSGRWEKQMFQDGCEEASAVMAVAWVRGDRNKTIPLLAAEQMIREVTAWEKKRFGVTTDLSPEDTAVMLREYFELKNVEVKDTRTGQDIVDVLYDNALVIVPTDGKALKNPFYTASGPDRHMLVIMGYDPTKKQFITNDPGTRHGAGYRYSGAVLYEAIRAYATGDHEPIAGVRKAMIVVRK